MLAQPPYEVIATVHNQPAHDEGVAQAQLLPGTGALYSEDADGEGQISQAGANAQTKRVVINTGGAKTGPDQGADANDTSHPLDEPYPAGEHTYTVAFQTGDMARLRLSANATADPTDTDVGWDADGTITDQDGAAAAPTTAVGRGVELIDRGTDDDFLLVEFY